MRPCSPFRPPPMESTLRPQWVRSSGPTVLAETVSGAPAEGGSITATPEEASSEAWLEAQFDAPATIGAVSLSIRFGAILIVEAQDGSGTLKVVARSEIEATAGPLAHGPPQQTLAFAPVTTQRMRLTFQPAPTGPLPPVARMIPPPRTVSYPISRLRLHGGARINGFEAKAGFAPSVDHHAVTPTAPRGAVINPATVLDLTSKLAPDGRLNWKPPPGSWTIIRLGWSLTGAVNAPAEPEATGLEVDKLDAGAVRRYLGHYLDLYREASGDKLGPAGIQTLLTDSWEAGVQNWTPAMLAEFRSRRGYDPTRWLPVLTGRVVESADASERFLFDYRQTLKDLVVDNHYGVLAQELKLRGMGYYTEMQGDYPRAIADGMTVKARADIPTAEFWYRPWSTPEGQPPLKADLEEAASAAHVYGKPLVAAEALTVAAPLDPWSFSPAMLKPIADEIFARGVNRILIHESHLQPLVDARPGLGLYIFGQYFNRNETWAEHAAPWVRYLSRSSYLLQQGQYVADVAYFYGEERNLTELFKDRVNTDVPRGYAYDYINPEALLTLLSIRDGRLLTPSGMSYRVLFLPDAVRRLSLPALRKLHTLVAGGAVLVAKRPEGSLGLGSDEAEFDRLVDAIWGDAAAPRGTGRVYADLRDALTREQVAPDIVFEGASSSPETLLALHRRTSDADIYFVSNQAAQAQSFKASFRVAGRAPELWRAETGETQPLSYEQTPTGLRTSLELAPHDAVFVVFRKPATQQTWTAPSLQRSTLATLQGPWKVAFQPGRGAPVSAYFNDLISWPEAADPRIKYFSGVAVYSRVVTVKRAWLGAGRRIELDLGDVKEIASVSVNGKAVSTAWHAPYRVDITKALRPGQNAVSVEVVNLWPNRLIGDKQPGAKPIAFAPSSPYTAASPLLPSGLLGPVRLVGVGAAP